MALLKSAIPLTNTTLLFLLASLISVHGATSSSASSSSSTTDILVIGGGTAGCVLAARLCTLLPSLRVTVLERGPPRTAEEEFNIRTARLYGVELFNPRITETLQTQPVPSLGDRAFGAPFGATLGGTIAIASVEFTRHLDGVIPKWEVTGLSEGRADRLFRKAARRMGARRPPRRLRQTVTKDWIRAAREEGFEIDRRPLKRGKDGDGDTVYAGALLFARNGRRQDMYTNYLKPAMNGPCRGRVTIVQDAKVEKLLFSSDMFGITSRAFRSKTGTRKMKSPCSDTSKPCIVGAQYTTSGGSNDTTTRVVTASSGVIVSAGPFGSPLLLQRSGIGPASVLRDAGVTLVKDLPVGQQAQGRIVTTHFISYGIPSLAPENNFTLLNDASARTQFTAGRGGPLGIAVAGGRFTLRRDGTGSSTSALPSFFVGNQPMLLTSCSVTPDLTSRASISLPVVAEQRQQPVIRLNGLESGTDLQRARRCARRVREVHMKLAEEVRGAEALLGFDAPDVDLDTEEGLNKYLRATIGNGQEFVGSCGVGRVVD